MWCPPRFSPGSTSFFFSLLFQNKKLHFITLYKVKKTWRMPTVYLHWGDLLALKVASCRRHPTTDYMQGNFNGKPALTLRHRNWSFMGATLRRKIIESNAIYCWIDQFYSIWFWHNSLLVKNEIQCETIRSLVVCFESATTSRSVDPAAVHTLLDL